MRLGKLKADAGVNVRFVAEDSPILNEDKTEGWGSQIGSAARHPHLGSLKPTGQPPTGPTINFSGSLQDLIEAAVTAQPGAVIDLNGKCVQVRPCPRVSWLQAVPALQPSAPACQCLKPLGARPRQHPYISGLRSATTVFNGGAHSE